MRRVARVKVSGRASGLTALLALVATTLALTSGTAMATGTLTSPYPLLFGVSCSGPSLCVAIDDKSKAIVSTDPTAPRPTWRASALGLVDPEAISCVATSLCVAVDSNGMAASSVDPTAVAPTWSTSTVFDHRASPGVSCPSTSLCVAVGGGATDGGGFVGVSTNPTAPSPVWSTSVVDDTALAAVSCPGTSLCVAVDVRGRAISSDDPAAADPRWTAPAAVDGDGLSGVSCPSTTLCVAVDGRGAATSSTDPGADRPTWSMPVATGVSASRISCPAENLCAAVSAQPLVAGVFTTDALAPGASWNAATTFGFASGESPASISCASVSLCAIVARTSASISTAPFSTNPAWSAPSVIDEIPAGDLKLSGPIVTRGSTISFSAHCVGEPVRQCPGTATLSALERLSRGGHRVIGHARTSVRRTRRVVVGRATFTPSAVAAGATRLAIGLNRTGRHLLSRFARLPALLTVTAQASEARVPPRTIVVESTHVTFSARR
jgi:hypothetical protein